MKKVTPMEILKVFDSNFYSNYANKYSLEELASDFGISLKSHSDFLFFMHEIKLHFLIKLFQHEPFLNLPVLGMCQEENKTFYILEAVNAGRCLKNNIDIYNYAGIHVFNNGSISVDCFCMPRKESAPAKVKTVRDLLISLGVQV